jgi:hypothetical protein
MPLRSRRTFLLKKVCPSRLTTVMGVFYLAKLVAPTGALIRAADSQAAAR